MSDYMKRKIITILFVSLSFNSFSQAPNWLWSKACGSTGDDSGLSIALDASGNIYTTGYFEGTVDFDPGVGVFNLTSAGSYDIFISKLDPSGNFAWAKRMGGVTDDWGLSIALDASGNIYTTGYFGGTADFDPGAAIFNLTSLGAYNIFVSKLDPSGNFVWAKGVGGTAIDAGYAISLDSSNAINVAGYFTGTVDFDPGVGVFNLSSGSNNFANAFILRLDNAGNLLWAKAFEGINYCSIYSMTLAAGNIYTTGEFIGTVDFDPGSGTFNMSSVANNDIFISKIDSSGNFVWAKSIGGTDTDEGISLTTDLHGNVYTTGYFGGTVDFDPAAGVFNLTSTSGSYDIFISKLDTAGNFKSAKMIGGIYNDVGKAIITDSSDNIYITGYFSDTADFDPGVGEFNLISQAGSADIFLSKLDSACNFLCAKAVGGINDEASQDIALNSSGNTFVIRYFYIPSLLFTTP